MKKISNKNKISIPKPDTPPTEDNATQLKISDGVASSMAPDSTHQIAVKIHGMDDLTLTGQLKRAKGICEAVKATNEFLLDCSDITIQIIQRLAQDSSIYEAHIKVLLNLPASNPATDINHVYSYLEKGSHAIFTCDYSTPDYIDVLTRTLTHLSIEIDELIDTIPPLYDSRCINKIKLAKTIEKFSTVDGVRNTPFAFEACYNSEYYGVKPIEKRKAIDILGGKYLDEKIAIGYFVVNKITFENIEKKLEFILDGARVDVFIVAKKWINKFNDHQIKITKGDRIKAKFIVERSPISKKLVYYFVEII